MEKDSSEVPTESTVGNMGNSYSIQGKKYYHDGGQIFEERTREAAKSPANKALSNLIYVGPAWRKGLVQSPSKVSSNTTCCVLLSHQGGQRVESVSSPSRWFLGWYTFGNQLFCSSFLRRYV